LGTAAPIASGEGSALAASSGGGQRHARRAKAALDRLLGHQRLLDGVRTVAAQPLDGGNSAALGLGQGDLAASLGLAIHQHGAGAAIAGAAAIFGAGEIGAIAQGPQQRHPGIEREGQRAAIDGERDRHKAFLAGFAPHRKTGHAGRRRGRASAQLWHDYDQSLG
jgi:hypothetical protein